MLCRAQAVAAFATMLFSSNLMGGSYDLLGLYSQALNKSEQVAKKDNEAAQAAERRKQANGAFLPSLSASSVYQRIDTSSYSNDPRGTAPDEDQTTTKLTLSQPLFQGGGEYAGRRAANLDEDIAKLAVQASRLQLFAELSRAFYAIHKREKELANVRELMGNVKSRVGELRRFTQIGKNRRSELNTGLSQQASVRAQELKAAADLEIARSELLALVPLEDDFVLQDRLDLPKSPKGLSEYLAKLKNRPDYLTALYAQKRAEETIAVARSGHFPSVGVDANYYVQRPGTMKDSKWDVAVGVSVPIFNGGITSSKVSEAALAAKNAELSVQEFERQNTQALRQLHLNFVKLLEQLAVLSDAIKISKSNYNELLSEYRQGIINYLDVIQAENSYWEMRRTHDQAFYDAKTAWIDLNVAAGEIL